MPADAGPRQLGLFGEPDAAPAGATTPALPDAAARAFAVDPSNNVVLEASAGTGKTSVLVRRYLALLAADVDPRNILAITFTRKAAAEMRERIVGELRRGADLSPSGHKRWLKLRDRLGEIAISTIDAFCLALLREFPLEADVDPSFEVADETEVARLVDDALDDALRITRAQAATDEEVALVFAQLSTPRARQGLKHLLDRRHVAPAALGRYVERFPPNLDARTAVARAVERALESLHGLPGGLDGFLRDGPNGMARFQLLAADLRGCASGALDVGGMRAALDGLAELFLTQKGEPRRRPHGYGADECLSREAWARHKRAIEGAAAQMANVMADLARDVNASLARGVQRIFAVAHARYRRSLAEHDVVDFAEALERAVTLLEQMDEFAQSRYRLESRYHHVLVDEFQDTSRLQWRLVELLVQSWGEGFGLVHEAPLPPSIFVVGDRKQSIYRFRDAEVAVLDEAGRFIAGLRPGSAPRRSITHSFRAVPELLRFVNDVFTTVRQVEGRSDAFRYGPDDQFPLDTTTAAAGTDADGLSPLPIPDSRLPIPDSRRFSSDPPVGVIAADDARTVTAAIGDEIARLLREGVVRDPKTGARREVRPGDVAVLFRTRESHRDIEQALEQRRIPSYVYKGLGFFDTDEIQDLSALLRYLAAPHSAARAAAFLRSRFVRLSDAALRVLGKRIATALTGTIPEDAWSDLDNDDRRVLAEVRAALPRWLAMVDRVPPAEVLDTVVADSAYAYELRGPRRLQAEENVKKLRALVRRIQNRGYATLDRLTSHLDRLSAGDEANAAIDATNAVNLMTVHAAKGLEFPIVFVVNLSRGSGTIPLPVRVVVDAGQGEPDVSVGAFRSDVDQEEKTRDQEETKRLLYVAMTRARDRLYLATLSARDRFRPGGGSLGEVLPDTIRDLFPVAAGDPAAPRLTWTPAAGAPHELLVCRSTDARPGQPTPAERLGPGPSDAQPVVTMPGGPPEWTVTTVSALVREPGGTGQGRGLDPPADAVSGRLVHRLFQQGLPLDLPHDEVAALASRLLRQDEVSPTTDTGTAVEEAVQAYLALRSRVDLRELLSPGRARFEVPFSYRDEANRVVVRGTIDCLAQASDGHWVVVELKTGGRAGWHTAQLDRYVDAARALFPESRVEGWLVYARDSARSM